MASSTSRPACKDCAPGSKRPAPHPGPRCATHHRAEVKRRRQNAKDKRLQAVYSIDREWYDALLAHQGGVCAICQRANGSTRALAVDHDHACCDGPASCGKCVRGLLCKPCNRMLGHLRDDQAAFQRAALYLSVWPSRAVSAPNASARDDSS